MYLSYFLYRHELKKASHITKLPKGKHSVKGETEVSMINYCKEKG